MWIDKHRLETLNHNFKNSSVLKTKSSLTNQPSIFFLKVAILLASLLPARHVSPLPITDTQEPGDRCLLLPPQCPPSSHATAEMYGFCLCYTFSFHLFRYLWLPPSEHWATWYINLTSLSKIISWCPHCQPTWQRCLFPWNMSWIMSLPCSKIFKGALPLTNWAYNARFSTYLFW